MMDCSPKTNLSNTTLAGLVDDYLKKFDSDFRADQRRYRSMPDLKTAIRNAALARRADDKCESHQRRIGLPGLTPFEQRLQSISPKIEGCTKFDELHDLLREHQTHHIGPLAVYDTAQRIGHYLEFEPEKVYLHAGTATGAKNLGLDTRGGFLDRSDLPEPLRQLTCAHIENFLCIYKDCFSQGSLRFSRGPARSCRPPRTGTC